MGPFCEAVHSVKARREPLERRNTCRGQITLSARVRALELAKRIMVEILAPTYSRRVVDSSAVFVLLGGPTPGLRSDQ